MTTPIPDALLAPSDIADLAHVSRSVVSNWRKRSVTFPEPIAGSDAKPLFSRDQVVAWLRLRGHDNVGQSAGARIWSALNALRGLVSMDDAAQVVLLLATIKSSMPSTFAAISEAQPASQCELIRHAAREIEPRLGAQITDARIERILQSQPGVSVVVEALSSIADQELAEGVDDVLARSSRSQVKVGAEYGFVGSRTSSLLASLIGTSDGVVYDPACGIANLLVQVAKQNVARRLIGSDINQEALGIAAQRSLLHNAAIQFYPARDVLREDPDPELRADVVLAEPPLGLRWDPKPGVVDPRYAFGLPPASSSELAWIQHVIAHLAPRGNGYVLTSPGALSRGGAERKIRANLLSAGCVEAIVTLPPKMLPHTSIGLALWVLRSRGELADVMLIDAGDVDGIETVLSQWVGRGNDHPVVNDAPNAVVPVADLLAAESVLTPARWVDVGPIDADAILSRLSDAVEGAGTAVDQIAGSSLSYDLVADLPQSRLITVGELVRAGVVEVRLGRPDRSRDLEEDAEPRVVRASDIRNRTLADLAGVPAFSHADLTQAGDVLVTTMHEVRALVDPTGGHLPSTGVERLRIRDRSVISPEYLAAVIVGPWNARLQQGTTIQRAPIRELEIPLLPRADQDRVVAQQLASERLRTMAVQLAEQARRAQDAALDAIRFNVPISRGSDVGDQLR
ncbi:N-6 DNA methylase [Planctomonas sp. JC2975]|uniref:N-6 DNA methylase n=1 Tax=Planctomonas sp. JC2975 TaxID=2729626 RepID=UPI001474C254|nr:N-6 DNA methylase [Planctomonas sp. JC2975]NNC12119.1 N-6 DNA methylase [Planctomonas sp. JC2975]